MILAFFVLLAAAHPVRAEFDDKVFTEREKVGFAFYHLANIVPKFEHWVKTTTAYRDTPAEMRALHMQERVQKLKDGFKVYDPAKDFFRFMVPVKIFVPNRLQRDQMVAEGKDIPVELSLRFFDDGFFPFMVGESWIAVMMSAFNKHGNFTLSPSDFAVFMENLGMDPHAKSWDARIEVVLMPARVDISAPINRKGKNLWVMDTHIASIALWQSYSKKYVWKVYQAPWYQTEESVNLMKLYKR